MKHVVLNVAVDSMMTLAYSGVTGGMLIPNADDPSAHSSQTSRTTATALCWVFSLWWSPPPRRGPRRWSRPPTTYRSAPPSRLFRTTTRVNHAHGVVELGPRAESRAKGHFDKDVVRSVSIPANARVNRKRLLELMRRARGLSEESPSNFVESGEDVGIITSDGSYTYVRSS